MIITSAGIFGFLSSAYQKSSLDFKLSQERIVGVESSKGYYSSQIKSSEERIKILNGARKLQEVRLSEALTNVILSRNPIQLQQIQQQTLKSIDQANSDIKIENDKIELNRSKAQEIDEKVNQMKIGSSEKKDIQTFKFLADALNTDLDTVAKWFIVSLIFVFDPLAIALILAYNVVIYSKNNEIVQKPIVKLDPMEPVLETVEEEKVEEVVKNEEPLNNTEIVTSNPPNPVVTPETVAQSSMNEYYKRMFKH
jgi:hypothetical protein